MKTIRLFRQGVLSAAEFESMWAVTSASVDANLETDGPHEASKRLLDRFIKGGVGGLTSAGLADAVAESPSSMFQHFTINVGDTAMVRIGRGAAPQLAR